MDAVRDAYLASPEGGAGSKQQPYGYGGLDNFENLIAVADALGVSTDYLLGRDVPEPSGAMGIWHNGDPEEPGSYIVFVKTCFEPRLSASVMQWDGGAWSQFGVEIPDEWTVYLWTERPKINTANANDECSLGAPCKTGISQSGKCGAAAYCDEPVDCCLNCGKACGCRCGWIEEDSEC